MLKPISEALGLERVTTEGCVDKTIPASNNASSSVGAVAPQQQKIRASIGEAANLVEALESVGAMYGIPATNIVSDDTASSIKVVDDTIVAPPIGNPSAQITPIMQAIGAVLDYISQRIDSKINDFQLNNVAAGEEDEYIKFNENPEKGKCVGKYEDDNGGKILAYDTGLVDCEKTPEAYAKVNELRAAGTIPSIGQNNMVNTEPSYFNDEDDITNGLSLNASSDEAAGTYPIEEFSIADEIGEKRYHVEMYSRFGDTRYLGHDILSKHGFENIKPLNTFIQESSGSKKRIKPEDIRHCKFDNSGIKKAVEYFNKARADQDEVNNGKINIASFINNPNYEKAIDSLNKQFDCRINLRFISSKEMSQSGNAMTWVFNDVKKKMTISKSKGFQLGGLPIDIEIINHYLEYSSPNDIELFGQNMVSTILHEIFHNISAVMRYDSVTTSMSLAMAMNIAGSAKTAKERRIVITNYVNSLDPEGNLINRIAKKKLVKELALLASVQEKESHVDKINSSKKRINQANSYTENLIKLYKKSIKRFKSTSKPSYILGGVLTGLGIIGGAIIGFSEGLPLTIGFAFLGLFSTVNGLLDDIIVKQERKLYDSAKIYEEYYCDLFAGMYKLPKFFFVGFSNNKYVANEIDPNKLKELVRLESEFNRLVGSKYPSGSERTSAGLTIARSLLKNKDLNSDMKKYCQWIVDNFSSLDHTGISEIYNKTTFDPAEAEDLDKHLQDIINDNNIVLTESFYVNFIN